ncbi:hypothetical protein M1523_04870 [Patescibacteria group bacterium]|nr:hypothetical protein [Patescibacteria group bacterium]MCL5091581.1 hypothetical protein [Patescibacteria group bacterium]
MERRNYDLEIIAGPCSITPEGLPSVYKISEIMVSDGKGGTMLGVSGTRMVGLKSRTGFDPTGKGMGIDAQAVWEESLVLPSVAMAEQVVKDTGLLVAAEIMMPEKQMRQYVRRIPPGKLLAWNPSVDQLGWHVKQIADFARVNGWDIGLKNGKWLGEPFNQANAADYPDETSLERAWVGLASYAGKIDGRLIMIHRGVDIPEKGLYRSLPVHEVARRAKRKAGALLYFDPSHSLGPNLRDQIVQETVTAMLMKDGNDWLYDGILIEAGQAPTDTNQHLSVNELEVLVSELAKFRRLRDRHTHR